jgi:ATP-dependent RNA helicase HelY
MRAEEDHVGDVEAEIALRSLRPGDVVVFDASNLRGRGVVISTAARRSGIRLTVLTPSRKQVDITARDLLSVPVRGTRIDLPVPFEPATAEFVREAVARLVKARIDEGVVTPRIARSGRQQREVVDSSRSVRRLRKEIEQMEERSRTRAGSVNQRFMDVVDLLADLGYVDGWQLTDKGAVLAGIFHESDLLVVEVVTGGVLDRLSPADLVACVSCLVFEPRGSDSGHVRWPNDTVRNRFKRMEKTSMRLNEMQRARGMQLHRSPNAGLAMDAMRWSQGCPLSEVLDPDLTPGDFVRSMRQIIDLLRQIEIVAPGESLRDAARTAAHGINRGVVAAAAGESAP